MAIRIAIYGLYQYIAFNTTRGERHMENRLAADKFEQIEFSGGTFFRANQKKFPALRGLAVQQLKLKPGAVREPHTHPNAEQLDYCVSGHAQVGIVGPEGHKQ